MTMKKIFLGIALCGVVGLTGTACGNKNSQTHDRSEEDTELTIPQQQLVLPETIEEDAALAATLDQLTADNDSVDRGNKIYVTPTGLKFRIVKEGTGRIPTPYNTVEVNYEGKTLEGKTFDSSYARGQSISFPLTRVIEGWTEGLQYMREGAVYEFYIPSNLAYKERGAGPDIGPNADLLFKVELIKVK